MMGTGRGTDLEGYWRCKQRHYQEASGRCRFGDLGLFCKRMYAAFY